MRFILCLFLITVLTLVSASSVLALSLTRDLKTGDQGVDVLDLQRFLNQDFRTQLATKGEIGGPGQETSYFGPKTTLSVTKFQELYAAEVLYPLGLFRGTGYVGNMTRKKISLLVALPIVLVPSTNPTPIATPPVEVSTTDVPTYSTHFQFELDPNTSEEQFASLVESFASNSGQVLGASTSIFPPFGGLIITAITCTNGILITVGPPVPGEFLFVPIASQLFMYEQLRPGPWSLGLANGIPTNCNLSSGNIPVPQGTIIIVGTSL
ncbi:MAG TPA: hypothetical protein VJJ24_03215 [Candidatus Paceibacterota bacterium]